MEILSQRPEITRDQTSSQIKESQKLDSNDYDEKQKVEASTQDLKGSSMAFKRPGLAHAQRYTAIQEAMEESKNRNIPEQFSSANHIKSLARESAKAQIVARESAKTVGITASGISKMV